MNDVFLKVISNGFYGLVILTKRSCQKLKSKWIRDFEYIRANLSLCIMLLEGIFKN